MRYDFKLKSLFNLYPKYFILYYCCIKLCFFKYYDHYGQQSHKTLFCQCTPVEI